MKTNNVNLEPMNLNNQVEETPISSIKADIQALEEISKDAEKIAKDLEKPKAKKTLKLKKKSSTTEPKEEKPKTKKSLAKAKAIKDTAKAQKTSLTEEVVSQREVKWIYPEDCIDTLSRKSWRQKQRNHIRRLERALFRIEDHNSKEFKAKKKELDDFTKEVLKPGQAI